MKPLSSITLTLPAPAGVSADSAGRDLLLLLLLFLLHHRPAVRTSRLPQEHPGHQAAPQGPTAHPHQVLQQHGRQQEGGRSQSVSSVGLNKRQTRCVHSPHLNLHECDRSVSAQSDFISKLKRRVARLFLTVRIRVVRFWTSLTRRNRAFTSSL